MNAEVSPIAQGDVCRCGHGERQHAARKWECYECVRPQCTEFSPTPKNRYFVPKAADSVPAPMVAAADRSETCQSCGTKIAEVVPTWWNAPDDLWLKVYGTAAGLRCPRCFTTDAQALGLTIRWEAVLDA